MGEKSLKPEQEEFIKACEEEFKSRYTSDDEDFMKIKNRTTESVPPIADPWFNKSRKPHHSNNPSHHQRSQHQGHSHYDRPYSRPYDRPYDRRDYRQERSPYYRRR